MIPLRDDVPSRTFPVMNIALIGLNILAWFYELSLGPHFESFLREFAVVPGNYFQSIYREQAFSAAHRVIPLFTSMFLHGGWLHVIGNMLFLYIFGDNVEDRVGHFRYLIFYLLCGLAAALTHIITNATSTVPTLGASGAIAGVLGAYLLLYPRARVVALLPVFVFLHVVEVRAVFFLGLWFVYQFLYGTLALGTEGGGVAWWAHIGGFIAGAVLIWGFRKRRYRPAGRDTWWAR